ncbi:FAD-binding and (Fe-S)-binding domain-containing protein [Actinoallomurus rhizosphaericola]|uniref:FAD-binding and (Fe-S)-binding domain-containing protein n=1 Tax=Actinoallomurus rhizosphaericola TaxID=2952536 RepID=UPI00209274CB|nr:FAD-binding and (Fe-S)-binding domain-containing protein [Actinoallomurus rhizosphaericola]MCO5997050.1 FAD-binding oxidoreductase [Actinoallomurus rhizosphaericola]
MTRTGSRVDVPAKSAPQVPAPPRSSQVVKVRALERALREQVEGEVRFDTASKAMYASDASNFRQVPIGVVVPRTLDDVVAVHRVCARFGAPIVNRGGGTSLSGETVNYAVVIDHTKYLTRIGETDAARRLVTCEPGVINEQLNKRTGEKGLVFGPDPSSHSRCAIGGNLGNNSCGIHSLQSQLYGPGPRTSDNVHAMEIVTYGGERFWVGNGEEDRLEEIITAGGVKGEIYARLRDLRDRYAHAIRAGYRPVSELPRRVSGFNLDELLPERGFNVARALVGTESTCATALRVTLMLTPALMMRTTVVVAFGDIADAAEHVPEIVERWRPIGLEGIDRQLIQNQRQEHRNVAAIGRLPHSGDADGWLLVQFGADTAEESVKTAHDFIAWLCADKGYARDRIDVLKSEEEGGVSERVWAIREGGLGATAFPPDGRDHWPGWEDSAVPPERLGDYIRDLRELWDRHDLHGQVYGHFGQGCLHSRISFDLRTAQGIANYRAFMEDAADLVVSYGGTLSGEHGDGQQRAELLDRQYGPELIQAMREFKLIWDPEWKMNPGKVVDPYRLDENLRLGTSYDPPRPRTRFTYQEDGDDFAHAMLRCVGVGKCRVPEADDQVMCPSYQVTREEKHSTRGRARLLFEMLQGDVVTDGWRSREVYDALDLCLACKGCTNDCPVNVDMPTYKSEFLYHHYRSLRRWRPRYAYAMGFIDQACRLGARIPEIANVFLHAPGLARLTKWAGGVDRRRPAPWFAPMTLQRWFRERGGTTNPYGRPVVLFPDTFNNHFHTDVGVACVEAIEAAGRQVVMPEGHVCCGRPLYDYGFLDIAERYLRDVLDVLREHIRAGTPVVGMEPSCVAVFKDELARMLPHDDDAARLARNAYHFAEFFQAFGIEPPRLEAKALLWGHCHHKATGGTEPEKDLLAGMGLQVREVEGGCCGLAGSWGFEQGKYDISLACGEQALLPAVRRAAPRTLVVANGFSCKSQIEDARTGRRAMHVGQVMKLARDARHGERPADRPEQGVVGVRPAPPLGRRVMRVALPVAVGGALGAGAFLAARNRRSTPPAQSRPVASLVRAARP